MATFSEKLRREIDRSGMSVRGLAKRLDQRNPETARRNLMRYLAGSTRPGAPMRDAIADALGVDRERLAADDEEEEADPMALFADLLHVLDRRYGVNAEARA